MKKPHQQAIPALLRGIVRDEEAVADADVDGLPDRELGGKKRVRLVEDDMESEAVRDKLVLPVSDGADGVGVGDGPGMKAR